ncbi:NADP-dependent oxidoreductase [Micropruina sp.]|uniref:NADP-dependent oxidoreductase n=1 Tax=Micropruina sp. TaxID=2737536 RepID=UPI0039E264FB
MNRVIQYRRFGGTDVLEMDYVAEQTPEHDQVCLAVKAVGLNPLEAKTFAGDRRLRLVAFVQRLIHPQRWFEPAASRFPRGVARDFAGVIEALGSDVTGFAVGDEVLGTLRGAPGVDTRGALAEQLVAPVSDVVLKPAGLSFDIAASLGVAAQTACGAFRQIALTASDVLVISAASGGVGSLAVQLAVQRGATVIGIAGERNADYLRSLGAIPVAHGEGIKDRILAAAPRPVTKLLDCYGGEYVKLGFALGLPGRAIGTLVPSPGAITRGAQFTGSRHAQPEDLPEVVGLVANGTIKVTLAHVYPFALESVRVAYAELNSGHVRGKLVVSLS